MLCLEPTTNLHANLIFKNNFTETLRIMLDQTSVYCGLCLPPGPSHEQGPLVAQ